MNKKDIRNNNDSSYVAKIGWQSLLSEAVYDFGYISSFKEAADDLVSREIPDLYVFPIVFCYRQYLELALKNIVYISLKNDDDYRIFVKKVSHDLEKIWSEAKPYLQHDNITDIKGIEFLEGVVKDFVDLDPTSFNFRYPKDKQLNNSLDNHIIKNSDGTIDQLIINTNALRINIDNFDNIIRLTYDSM